MSSTTLCISSIKRRRRESFTCKQKQHTQLCIKRSSPLYPHGSIWCPHHDDTNHGPHHQQTPLVEATSSPPHEFSGAKAGFLNWADKLFACTTPGLGVVFLKASNTAAAQAARVFFLVGFPMLLVALPHIHEVGGLAQGDGEADDVR